MTSRTSVPLYVRKVKAKVKAAGYRLEENFPIIGEPKFCIPSLRLAIFFESPKSPISIGRGTKRREKPSMQPSKPTQRSITRTLRRFGWTILRLSNRNADEVSERLLAAVNAKSKQPKSGEPRST